MALYSFSLRPLPLFAWLSLAGALMAIILSWFYVPFLAKAALAANKRCPCTIRKRITFFMRIT